MFLGRFAVVRLKNDGRHRSISIFEGIKERNSKSLPPSLCTDISKEDANSILITEGSKKKDSLMAPFNGQHELSLLSDLQGKSKVSLWDSSFTQDIVMQVSHASRSGLRDPNSWHEFSTGILAKLNNMKSHEIAAILRSLADARYRDPVLLRGISEALFWMYQIRQSQASDDLPAILESFRRLKYRPPIQHVECYLAALSNTEDKNNWQQKGRDKILILKFLCDMHLLPRHSKQTENYSFSNSQVDSSLIDSALEGNLKDETVSLIGHLLKSLSSDVGKMGSIDLASTTELLHDLRLVSLSEALLVRTAVIEGLSRNADRLKTQDLVRILRTFCSRDELMAAAPEGYLVKSIFDHVSKNLISMSPSEITELISLCRRMQFRSPPLLSQLGRAVQSGSAGFSSKQLSSILLDLHALKYYHKALNPWLANKLILSTGIDELTLPIKKNHSKNCDKNSFPASIVAPNHQQSSSDGWSDRNNSGMKLEFYFEPSSFLQNSTSSADAIHLDVLSALLISASEVGSRDLRSISFLRDALESSIKKSASDALKNFHDSKEREKKMLGRVESETRMLSSFLLDGVHGPARRAWFARSQIRREREKEATSNINVHLISSTESTKSISLSESDLGQASSSPPKSSSLSSLLSDPIPLLKNVKLLHASEQSSPISTLVASSDISTNHQLDLDEDQLKDLQEISNSTKTFWHRPPPSASSRELLERRLHQNSVTRADVMSPSSDGLKSIRPQPNKLMNLIRNANEKILGAPESANSQRRLIRNTSGMLVAAPQILQERKLSQITNQAILRICGIDGNPASRRNDKRMALNRLQYLREDVLSEVPIEWSKVKRSHLNNLHGFMREKKQIASSSRSRLDFVFKRKVSKKLIEDVDNFASKSGVYILPIKQLEKMVKSPLLASPDSFIANRLQRTAMHANLDDNDEISKLNLDVDEHTTLKQEHSESAIKRKTILMGSKAFEQRRLERDCERSRLKKKIRQLRRRQRYTGNSASEAPSWFMRRWALDRWICLKPFRTLAGSLFHPVGHSVNKDSALILDTHPQIDVAHLRTPATVRAAVSIVRKHSRPVYLGRNDRRQNWTEDLFGANRYARALLQTGANYREWIRNAGQGSGKLSLSPALHREKNLKLKVDLREIIGLDRSAQLFQALQKLRIKGNGSIDLLARHMSACIANPSIDQSRREFAISERGVIEVVNGRELLKEVEQSTRRALPLWELKSIFDACDALASMRKDSISPDVACELLEAFDKEPFVRGVCGRRGHAIEGELEVAAHRLQRVILGLNAYSGVGSCIDTANAAFNLKSISTSKFLDSAIGMLHEAFGNHLNLFHGAVGVTDLTTGIKSALRLGKMMNVRLDLIKKNMNNGEENINYLTEVKLLKEQTQKITEIILGMCTVLQQSLEDQVPTANPNKPQLKNIEHVWKSTLVSLQQPTSKELEDALVCLQASGQFYSSHNIAKRLGIPLTILNDQYAKMINREKINSWMESTTSNSISKH